MPFHIAPWGGDRDRAMAVFYIHQFIVALVIHTMILLNFTLASLPKPSWICKHEMTT